MTKNIVRLDIVDSDPERETERILSTFYLLNPDMDKLNDYKRRLEMLTDTSTCEIEGIWDIEDYIKDNFETAEVDSFEIKW